MKLILFILNLPFTLMGVIPMILSSPYHLKFITNPYAFVFKVKSFWWGFGFLKNARAITIGHTILMGPRLLKNDLEHEIIHVEQCDRYPVIFPILYIYERIRKGYRQNRFEDEAYTLSNSIYEGPKSSKYSPKDARAK